jgi:hypothetical protein
MGEEIASTQGAGFLPRILRLLFSTSILYDGIIRMALTTTMARVRTRAEDLKVSAKVSARQLAVLVDMSPTVLGNAFSGVTYIGAEKESELAEVTLLLVELELAVRPLRLPDDTDNLRTLVDYVRAHKVAPDHVRASVQQMFGIAE